MTGIRITISRAAGSTPRDAGTQMMVWETRIDGTIGGGELEWQAMAHARKMLRAGHFRDRLVLPLGPALGQCCGGSVTLDFEEAAGLAPGPRQPLWVYGAGHVGRAIVAILAPLPAWQITWVDTAAARFPDPIPDGVLPRIAAAPESLVPVAPADAHHLILTYSHQIDLALCHAILSRSFVSAGLIGSATKWARFKTRLAQLGHDPTAIARIACPIGDPKLGKHPQALAIGVAMAMLSAGTSARSGAQAG